MGVKDLKAGGVHTGRGAAAVQDAWPSAAVLPLHSRPTGTALPTGLSHLRCAGTAGAWAAPRTRLRNRSSLHKSDRLLFPLL